MITDRALLATRAGGEEAEAGGTRQTVEDFPFSNGHMAFRQGRMKNEKWKISDRLLPNVCHRPTCHLLPATCFLPPASCRLLPAVCFLPPASCHLLPAVCFLPSASHFGRA